MRHSCARWHNSVVIVGSTGSAVMSATHINSPPYSKIDRPVVVSPGAIHAASTLDGAPLVQLDEHRFAAVLKIKAQATEQLLQRLRDCTGRYLIYYSSAEAELGVVGQGRMRWRAAIWMGWHSSSLASVRQKSCLSPGEAWGRSCRAASPEMQAVLACRGIATLNETKRTMTSGIGCHAWRALYRRTMRMSTQHLSALQQRLFTEEDTAKPMKTEAPPATDHALMEASATKRR